MQQMKNHLMKGKPTVTYNKFWSEERKVRDGA